MTPEIKSLFSTALILGMASSVAIADEDNVEQKQSKFERHATFVVCENTSCDRDVIEETSSEIVTASKDGKTLIYTDSPLGVIGFVNIKDAERPQGLGTVDVGGEPTSVTVTGDHVLVAVNTSESFTEASGFMSVYRIKSCLKDILSCSPVATFDMGGQPDSIAASPDGTFAAVVIENERDEDLLVDGEEGGLPQFPAGYLNIVDINGEPSNWGVRKVDLTGLSEIGTDDPEPEYVDINQLNHAVVTMQENNHIAIVDLPSGIIINDFPAGEVTLTGVDNTKNKVIELNETIENLPREADAVGWVDNDRFATANEGDFYGGSRGFSIYRNNGEVSFDSGVEMEYLAVQHGHYPEKRAGKKGAEPEGVEVGQYENDNFLFVGSERGSFIAVYLDKGADQSPEFVQILPTGVGPEGMLAVPGRNLFVAAAEVDEDYRSQITIYKLREHNHYERSGNVYPTVSSDVSVDGIPIAWGALSGLAVDVSDDHRLYSVHDSFYKQSRIFGLSVSEKRHMPARITDEMVLLKNGKTVNYDLEGIVQKTDRGFWLVSEGKGTVGDKKKPFAKPNLLIEVDVDGNVLQEIELPGSLNAIQLRFGLEGVTRVGEGNDEKVYVVFQREWSDDEKGQVKIGRYEAGSGSWSFIRYELGEKSPAGGWVGLSEIVALSNDEFAVIERDNQLGADAAVKRIYRFSTFNKTFKPHGEALDLVSKNEQVLVNDVLQEMKKNHGYVLDKLEGLAITSRGRVYVITDNDGVDDSNGETQFLNLGDYGENDLF